jgi:hypothetical protein
MEQILHVLNSSQGILSIIDTIIRVFWQGQNSWLSMGVNRNSSEWFFRL